MASCEKQEGAKKDLGLTRATGVEQDSETGLLPCPWCGSKVEEWGRERAPRGSFTDRPYLAVTEIVECKNVRCGVQPQVTISEEYRSDTPDGYNKAMERLSIKARKIWNKRVASQSKDTYLGNETPATMGVAREQTGIPSQLWKIVDSRTGERASIESYFTQERAELQIERWKERDRKGGRPDCHELIPFLEARPDSSASTESTAQSKYKSDSLGETPPTQGQPSNETGEISDCLDRIVSFLGYHDQMNLAADLVRVRHFIHNARIVISSFIDYAQSPDFDGAPSNALVERAQRLLGSGNARVADPSDSQEKPKPKSASNPRASGERD